LVPNDCSAYHRARLLRLAVHGVADAEPYEHPADEQLLTDCRVPRDYCRPDLGWPAPPVSEAA
jgi:hypothetical protein